MERFVATSALCVALCTGSAALGQTVKPTVLRTYQGANLASPFAQPFETEQRIMYATGHRLTGHSNTTTFGIIQFFSVDDLQWQALGLATNTRCDAKTIRIGGNRSAVTTVISRRTSSAPSYSAQEDGVAQTCFMSGVFYHFGDRSLPPLATLAKDADFAPLKGKWYDRLRKASLGSGGS